MAAKAIAALLCASALSAQTPDPWKSLRFLIGTWEGKTQGGSAGAASAGVYTFQLDLKGHVLGRYGAYTACAGPADFNCEHGDMLYVYEAAGGPLKAIYFDNEGHTIHYDVTTPAADTAVFLSAAGQPGPRFRLTYELKGGVMSGKFQMSMPGQTEFRSYLEWAGGAAANAAVKDWSKDAEWIKKRYAGWGGPGVNPGAGPMDGVRLKDYAPQPSLVLPRSDIAKAKYPAIDVHAHVLARTADEVAEWVRTMEYAGVEKTVVLTGATGAKFDALADLYLKPVYAGRFVLFCGIDTTDIDKPDYPARAAAELARCYSKGGRGAGELSDKGLGFGGAASIPRAKRLHADDPRLDAFWDKAAGLKIPVNIHIADHPSAWQAPDVYQERTPDYQHFNQTGKDVPTYAELLAHRDNALARHPKTTFIACHLGNQGNDLAALGRVLDKYPNLYLDISARDYEVGRTPRAAAKFLGKYRGRVMFGTDISRELDMYRSWWRLFESEDEFMAGRVWWPYYGLALPAPVLESLYRGTAKKVLR